jgi:glycosyltransferase involved in cell wall biosynthesis
VIQLPAAARSWPLVSVVVATRHRPELLQKAISGILTQAYAGEIECLVVFDQSEPVTPIAPVASGRRLRVLTNTRTPGLAGARNTGILGAAGPVIALCDDDDVWQPDKLSRQVDLLDQAQSGFVAAGIRIRRLERTIERIPPAEVGLDQLARARVTALHPSTFVFRRSVVAEVGLIDEDIPGSYGEDYDLLLRAARHAPILAIQLPLVEVLWHEQSFFAERWRTIADAMQFMLTKHPELRADPVGHGRINGQIAFAEAALGRRGEACRLSWRALRGNPAERRAYLALAVATGIVPAAAIVRAANRRGRGI